MEDGETRTEQGRNTRENEMSREAEWIRYYCLLSLTYFRASYICTLKKEAAIPSENTETFYKTTRRRIPEHNIIHRTSRACYMFRHEMRE
jgi:hypothetical protein